MNVKYEIHTINNALGMGSDRYYIQLHEYGGMTGDELEEHLHTHYMLPHGEVKAVLAAITDCMTHELTSGRRFCLPGIGYFSLGVGLDRECSNQETQANASDIRVKKIRFKPYTKLLDNVRRSTHFERDKYSTKSKRYTEDEMERLLTDYLNKNGFISRRTMEQAFRLRTCTALKWIRVMLEKGVIKRLGAKSSPLYALQGN